MRLNIASKLFLGFLCVIGLNSAYLFVVYKINAVNTTVDLLKRNDDIKSRLIRLKTQHGVRSTSVLSFEKIGLQESIDNFRDRSVFIACLIDTISREIDSIIGIDLRLLPEKRHLDYRLATKKMDDLTRDMTAADKRYTGLFEALVLSRASPKNPKKASAEKAIVDTLDSMDKSIAVMLESGEGFIRERTNEHIAEISQDVTEVKKLIVLIIAGLTVFSLAFGLIFSRTITNALRRLKDSAGKIGKSDFDLIPSGFPNDEIGDLAKAFFNMSVDLRSKQEEIIKSKRLAAIGEVVASVNHEINNPLMIISGNAQFLEMSMEGYPADIRERVKTIIEETGRISEITRKLREIRNPVAKDYLARSGQMIDIHKSTQQKET
jgi:HAMP domain-containing protein